jgi:hypothetical protein
VTPRRATGRAAPAAGQSNEGEARGFELRDLLRSSFVVRRVAPRERQPVTAREVEDPHRRRGRARAEDLEPDARDALQRLASRDEGREQQVADLLVLEHQLAQDVALDRDVPRRLRRKP